MVAAYLRFSTNKQDEIQQSNTVAEYAKAKGITIDVIEKDEGVSGGVSYKNRRLYGLVKRMSTGDTLIVSEISRLGRSISDLNILVNEELAPRGVRLIAVKTAIDIDCGGLKAIDQMMLNMFSFAAQIEKELIQSRTQSALDARKVMIEKDGGFISKAGNFCTQLGNKKGCDMTEAHFVANGNRTKEREKWQKESCLFKWIIAQVKKGKSREDIVAYAQEMFEIDPANWCTRNGRPLTHAILSKYMKYILPLV